MNCWKNFTMFNKNEKSNTNPYDVITTIGKIVEQGSGDNGRT